MVVESRGVEYPNRIVVRKLPEGEASINMSVLASYDSHRRSINGGGDLHDEST